MLKKISLRLRLTVLSIALLTLCCVGLTTIVNISAFRMANVIEATPIVPANEIDANGNPIRQDFAQLGMAAAPTQKSQDARQLFLFQSIAAMMIVVVVGGGLTYYIAGKALKPLQELSSQMKNRTVHNLSENLDIPQSRDEISDLTTSFNEMSSKLDESFATQKRFSQSAAHELRTPLTVLKTKVDVFKKKPTHTAAEYDKLLEVITTHTNRLSSLVKDLLELTNLDALDCGDRIELKPLLCGIAEELSSLAQKDNITVSLCGEAQSLCGNQSLLHRAFYNLIENAIKYNVENGEVQITIAAHADKISVTIADTGIGIPEELKKHIFEPFFRVDKSRSRQMGGAGLGLSTVQSIIDKHGGSIEVFANPNGGSIFKVTI